MAYTIRKVWDSVLNAGVSRRERRPCDYEAYVPDRLVGRGVTLSAQVAADISDAERAVQHLNAGGPVLASLEALARLLLRAESVASSRIEGLEVGSGRLLRAEAAREIGEPVNDVTAQAVLGNIEAMELAVNQLASKERIQLDDLLAVHRALMRHTHTPQYGGVVRTSQSWIGGNDYNPCTATFVPPPPEHVPGLLDDLIAFLNSEHFSPLVQAALVHAQFETIHPFPDGNGRVGRALIHVVLRRRGLAPHYVPPISLVLATRSRDYIAGLTAYRSVGPPDSPTASLGLATWAGLFAAATASAATDAQRFGEQIDALVQSWRMQASPVRKNSAADLLLRILPSTAVITVSTAARLIGRSFQAADLAIAHLTRVGVLRQITLGRRNRAFEAVGLVEALTGFERQLASPGHDTRVSPPVRAVPYRRTRPPAATAGEADIADEASVDYGIDASGSLAALRDLER